MFFFLNWQYFPTKQKKRGKKLRSPTGHNDGHPLDGKQKFFLGWPYTARLHSATLTISILGHYVLGSIRDDVECAECTDHI